jgi:hypothetical protein
MTKKVILLPLDERPCNALYPSLLPTTDLALVVAPRSLLGHKKTPADIALLQAWLLEECHQADFLILSFDMLIYGGLVPSRLHALSEGTLLQRASFVETLKKDNPNLRILAFELLMRCPFYSLSDEEPDYYAREGSAIFKSGYYPDKAKETPLTLTEQEDYRKALAEINQADLDDYLARREKNLHVLEHNLSYLSSGLIERLIVPNDDSSPYGYTARDKRSFFAYLKENELEKKVLNYPGADELGLSSLAAVNLLAKGRKLKVYPCYACPEGPEVIPSFEDRPLSLSVPAQIAAAGCEMVSNSEEADFVLAINVAPRMLEPNEEGFHHVYEEERNLPAFVEKIHGFLQHGKPVALADIALANGAEGALLHLLDSKGDLLGLLAYAGWNTSGNTLGSTLGEAVLAYCGQDKKKNEQFLLYRYYEDYGYMSVVRNGYLDPYLVSHPSLSPFLLDGVDGPAAHDVGLGITKTMAKSFPSLARYVLQVKAYSPWNRSFEVELHLTFGGDLA